MNIVGTEHTDQRPIRKGNFIALIIASAPESIHQLVRSDTTRAVGRSIEAGKAVRIARPTDHLIIPVVPNFTGGVAVLTIIIRKGKGPGASEDDNEQLRDVVEAVGVEHRCDVEGMGGLHELDIEQHLQSGHVVGGVRGHVGSRKGYISCETIRTVDCQHLPQGLIGFRSKAHHVDIHEANLCVLDSSLRRIVGDR